MFWWFHVDFLLLIQKSEEKLKKKESLEKDDKARKVTCVECICVQFLTFGKIS
jgi:hypothetical protein